MIVWLWLWTYYSAWIPHYYFCLLLSATHYICPSFFNTSKLLGVLNQCLKRVRIWMRNSTLKFTPNKTCAPFLEEYRLVNRTCFGWNSTPLESSSGFSFTFDQVAAVARIAFTISGWHITHSSIISYFNALFMSLLLVNFWKLQSVQISAAMMFVGIYLYMFVGIYLHNFFAILPILKKPRFTI